MHCKIIKRFDFSRDGFTTKTAEPNTERDIPDHLVDGLESEGYVQRVEAPQPVEAKMEPRLENKAPTEAEAVEIPENWQELSWPELRSLAARISATPIATKDDAESAIAAEVERRNG